MPRHSCKPVPCGYAAKQRLGAFYTAPDVATVIARHTLRPLLGESTEDPLPVVLDPACGEGQLLVAAWRELASACPAVSVSTRAELATRCLFGVDVDPAAATLARRFLAAEVLQSDNDDPGVRRLSKQLSANIVVGNTLLDDGPETNVFGSVSPGKFDAVLMNPPYLNRRRQSKQFSAEVLDFWPKRFCTAHGAYDLFVLFIERAWELLRDGGHCGAITPSKIATMNYAKPCRELLARRANLRWMIDASDVPLFDDVGVCPLLFGFEKTAGPRNPDRYDHVAVLTLQDRASLAAEALTPWPDASLDEFPPSGAEIWQPVPVEQLETTPWRLAHDLAVEARVPTVAAKDVADWHVGTPGFGAQRISKLLFEEPENVQSDVQSGGASIPFIVSGNIHRFQVTQQPMRFMKRRWSRPKLDPQHPKLTARQQVLFQQPKIVVAGMGQQLRFAWDDVGRALGVQVYAATNLKVPRHYLLALLNSTLMTRIFRQRYSGKRMSDNYLAVHKAQLQLLPIRTFDDACPLQQRLVELSAERTTLDEESAAQGPGPTETIDAEIDALVLQLYDVDEMELV